MWEVSLRVGNSTEHVYLQGGELKVADQGKERGLVNHFTLHLACNLSFSLAQEKQGDNQEDKARSGEKAGSARSAWAIPHDQTACFALLPPLIIELVLKTMTP